ncbi:sporulation protein, partial [Pauljensenia sp. UMB3104]|nr:sporulation protein [Pauljensenia sp. UMB3104]
SQQAWAPDDEALIYDTASSPSISIKGDEGSGTLTATVTVPAVASVNSEGVKTRSEDSMISSTFNLVQEGGQWRIDSPEDAFIVSQTAFSAAYEQANLYFPATTGDALVADPRWYPSRRLAS